MKPVGDADILMKRRLLDVLFLAYRNFANFDPAKNKATVDVLGMCIYMCVGVPCSSKGQDALAVHILHIGVGFCVARSYSWVGNAKASICRERVTGADSRAFLL